MVGTGASSDRFRTLAGGSQARIREKASRFIAYAFPIENEDAFKQRLASIAKEHFSARHHCYAWVLGTGGERTRSSDAAEPAGTAGQPILRRIQGTGLTHVAVVVVRYFGGTLLGKGGLVRAYGEAAAAALASGSIVEKVIMRELRVRCGHGLVGALRDAVLRTGGHVVRSAFGVDCEMTVAVPRSLADAFASAWMARGAEVDQVK